MKTERAIIVHPNREALRIAASAARISTQPGTAESILAKAGDVERDMALLKKVLASGHKSVIEHQTLSVAFNDVSVLVEQFVIEFRLASYTVKSRRYVDFSDAGFVLPESLTEKQRIEYDTCMRARFADYEKLLSLGIPKEDARFVLPYSLRSNFYMTVNARELCHMVCTMLYGRGARYEELVSLGTQLKAQLDVLLPGLVDGERARYACPERDAAQAPIADPQPTEGGATLIGGTADAEALLHTAMAFEGFRSVEELVSAQRPRSLEVLSYTFLIRSCSLACLTHFTRHRLQSPIIPEVVTAGLGGRYVLPATIRENEEASRIYRDAFEAQADCMRTMRAGGTSDELLSYLCMSGHQLDFLLTMDARELAHFARLRTCTRAQWEIRAIARDMLSLVAKQLPELFRCYGPSCAMTGRCPEGRMTCGHPVRIVDGEWIERS